MHRPAFIETISTYFKHWYSRPVRDEEMNEVLFATFC